MASIGDSMQMMKSILLPASVALCFTVTACQTTQPDRFVTNDTNRDGQLSRDEVNSYIVTGVFESRDANGDKQMTREEWGAGDDAAQTKAFRDRDANHDGIVSFDEALAYGRKKGMANQLVRAADTNKDGSLSREEVTVYYGSREGDPH